MSSLSLPSFHPNSKHTTIHSAFHYNAILRSHVQSHHPDRALRLFHQLLSSPSSFHPDNFTFPLALKACARLSALAEGQQIHCILLKSHPQFIADVFVQSSLINMYAQCGRMDCAVKLFDEMPHRNQVTWNSIIAGFAKSGNMELARRCFDLMPERNIVSWNSLVGGYVEAGCSDEVVKLLLEMQILGMKPDESTMVSLIKAIGDVGMLSLGRRAHGYVTRQGFSLSGALGVAVIAMYTKCGCIDAAYRVFLGVPVKNVGHWTSMIGGFAAHGRAEDSLQVFSEMISSGVRPNYVTFIGVLSACSHGGLADEGLRYFQLMRSFGIEPRIKHYGCLVDLLGRAGHIEEAMELISNLPEEPGFVVWSALLAACRNHGNVEAAEIVAERLVEFKPEQGNCYTLLSNLYGSMGRWEDLRRVKMDMEDRGVTKVPGFSWIEIHGSVHEFVAGDKFHVRKREIYGILDDMTCNLRLAGYEPQLDLLLMSMQEP